MMRPPSSWNKGDRMLLVAIIVCAVLGFGFIGYGLTPQRRATITTHVTQAKIPVPTKTPQPTATPIPPLVHYPPTTLADLHGLAAKGNADAVHEFHSESVGAVGVCPQAKREVTVDPSITGQQLTEDLLAYFYAQQLDNSCGSIVFAYHNQSEVSDINTGGVYTAGLVRLDVTDASGAINMDPNATDLKHTLTLNIGGFDSNQAYVVTY